MSDPENSIDSGKNVLSDRKTRFTVYLAKESYQPLTLDNAWFHIARQFDLDNREIVSTDWQQNAPLDPLP